MTNESEMRNALKIDYVNHIMRSLTLNEIDR
jgi:hypothetical protein